MAQWASQEDETSWVTYLKDNYWEEDPTAGPPDFNHGDTVWPSMPAAALMMVATKVAQYSGSRQL